MNKSKSDQVLTITLGEHSVTLKVPAMDNGRRDPLIRLLFPEAARVLAALQAQDVWADAVADLLHPALRVLAAQEQRG